MNTLRIPPLSGHGLLVAGTDTGVGKTHISCLLIEQLKQQGLRVAAMKPVAAGEDAGGLNEDVQRLMAASNVSAALQDVNPYSFAPPIAPHIAAQQAAIAPDLQTIARSYARLRAQADLVVVEGAGGLLVPLNASQDMSQIPKLLDLPVLLVVGMRLGCLNHALLTCEAIKARGLTLAGWVANVIDPDMAALQENIDTLVQRIAAPCWGRVEWLADD